MTKGKASSYGLGKGSRPRNLASASPRPLSREMLRRCHGSTDRAQAAADEGAGAGMATSSRRDTRAGAGAEGAARQGALAWAVAARSEAECAGTEDNEKEETSHQSTQGLLRWL
jgi:hypothetical protein